MEIKEVYRLMDRFESSSLTHLELNMEGSNIVFDKGSSSTAQTVIPQSTVAFNSTSASEETESAQSSNEAEVIKAPIVGTFYTAAAPGEEPFVKPGQTVKAGQVVGLIEAMKLMNEITAPKDGKILEILVGDEEMVQYDQKLMTME